MKLSCHSFITACVLAMGFPAHSAPVSTTTLEGKEPGPTVRVIVARTERAKACGVDEQLAGMKVIKGRLVIETHDKDQPVEPGKLGEGITPNWEIAVTWPKDVKDDFQYEAKPSPQRPRTSATDPAKTLARLREAIGDSFTPEALDLLKVAPIQAVEGSPQRVEMRFPAPKSGVAKSRQFRITRRFTAGLLEELGMIEPYTTVWPPGFPTREIVCNYDAQGVGYYGSTLLERVVDETTLDVHVVSVCGEDIRDGALDKAVGVMFPGGSGREIARALKPEGVEKVREFVARGNGFFGVCAGAYFAASGLEEYAGMMHLKHHQPWAKGRSKLKLELTEDGKDLLGSEFASIETNYNCGPVFTEIIDPPAGGDHQPVTVLANFASPATDSKGVTHESMVGTPAILSTTWKKGRVMTISPHPEGHPEFNALVGRCIGWSLGKDTKQINAR